MQKPKVQSLKPKAPRNSRLPLFPVLFIAIFHFPSSVIHAQDYPDAGLWNTFNLEYSLNSKFTGLFTQECRFRENFSRLNLFYTNLGIEYKAAKGMKVALVYRWIDKYQDDNSYSFRHRLMLDITGKYKFGKWVASYRSRVQVEGRDIYSSADGGVFEWYWRHKVGVKYDMERRYTPFVSAEFRYQLRDHRNVESNGTWHRGRYVLGIEYKINNRNMFSPYYLFQHEFNVITPQTQYVIGLEYNLTL